MKSSISVNGRQYISASRAAEITKYSRDYIGQLCRGGKIPATMVLRSWFVDIDALTNYKDTTEKNLRVYSQNAILLESHKNLLSRTAQANAQSETQVSVDSAPSQIKTAEPELKPVKKSLSKPEGYVYSADSRPFLPLLAKEKTPVAAVAAAKVAVTKIPSRFSARSKEIAVTALFVAFSGALFASAAFPDQTWNAASGVVALAEQAIQGAGNEVALVSGTVSGTAISNKVSAPTAAPTPCPSCCIA